MLGVVACDGATPPADGGEPEPDPEPSALTVVINEFVADNETGLFDEQGNYPDWLELKNVGDETVSLTDVTLSDDDGELDKFKFASGTTIAAGDYLVVFASGSPDLGDLHADFKLSKDGEALFLAKDGNVVDEVSWGAQYADISMGRAPDGEGDFDYLLTPTPGAANSEVRTTFPDAGGEVGPSVSEVTLNEVVAVNTDGLQDEAGDFEPWVELFNAAGAPQALEGHFLSDDPDELDKWAFGEVQIDTHLVVFLDGEATEGALHATVNVNANGGSLYFSGPDGTVLSELAYPALQANAAYGRVPDGSDTLGPTASTPNAANTPVLPSDAGVVDAGVVDAGAADAGAADAGAVDAGTSVSDAGATDAGAAADGGPADAGAADAGAVDAG